MWIRASVKTERAQRFFSVSLETSVLGHYELAHAFGKLGVSLAEYNAMLPWQVDLRVSQLERDAEESRNRQRQKSKHESI